jgi:hypothetical protein
MSEMDDQIKMETCNSRLVETCNHRLIAKLWKHITELETAMRSQVVGAIDHSPMANTGTLEHKLSEEQADGKLAQRETKDALEVSNSWWQIVEAQ